MKIERVRIIAFIAMVGALGTPVKAQNQSDMLENLTAVLAAEQVCNFNVDQSMLEMSIYSLFGDPATVSPGGKHWPEIQRNMARIKSLTATSDGRRGFCRTTRSNLSAFFR